MIKQLKEIEILSCTFTIEWDKKSNGGSFYLAEGKLIVGTKSIKEDPLYTMSILNHEIMEIILQLMGARYQNGRSEGYVFNFDHQTFENAIQIYTQTINKFICKT